MSMKAGGEGIPVCWMEEGTRAIKWGRMVAVEGVVDRRVVRLDDGGWNWAKDCFFTDDQCREYYRRPPQEWTDLKELVAGRLEKMAEALRKRRS
ncbi:MAG: hypothetical protein ABFE07_28780 [Armatimonadia bacterium]